MPVDLSEANQFIRLTMRQWNMEYVSVSFRSDLGGRRYGLYWFIEKKIELHPRILNNFALFKHTFYHELAHALDHKERGSLIVNGRMNAHGKNFNKWCKRLGIQKGRFIPKKLIA